MDSDYTGLRGESPGCIRRIGIAGVAACITQRVPGDHNKLPADTSQPEEEAVLAHNENTNSVMTTLLIRTPDAFRAPCELLPSVLPAASIPGQVPCTSGA